MLEDRPRRDVEDHRRLWKAVEGQGRTGQEGRDHGRSWIEGQSPGKSWKVAEPHRRDQIDTNRGKKEGDRKRWKEMEGTKQSTIEGTGRSWNIQHSLL